MPNEEKKFEKINDEIGSIFTKYGYTLKSNYNDNGTEWNLYSNGIDEIRLTIEMVD